jgi:formate dehydrogenase subunit beta
MVARSCDARAAVELAKRQQINLENLYVIGIECYGVVITGDNKGEVYIFPEEMEIDGKRKPLDRKAIAPHCLRCEYPVATMADVNCRIEPEGGCSVTANTEKGKSMLTAANISVKEGPQSDVTAVKERALKQQAAEFDELKNMKPEERLNYWLAQFDKCIKCYGCRNACPICYCKDCYLGPERSLVQRGGLPPEMIFHIGRLLHIGDSCVDCGQCESACPMGIPVSKLYHMLYKDLSPMFDYESGFDLESLPPVSTISEKDLTKTGVDLD